MIGDTRKRDDTGVRGNGSTLKLAAHRSFSFLRTVYSHGWYDLPPFHWDEAGRTLHRVLTASEGRALLVSIRQGSPGDLAVVLHAPAGARGRRERAPDRAEALKQVGHMLRLDEPFGEFHALCRDVDGFAWAADAKAGPLLRAPDPFEDLVKMICTTNCTWALTRVMVGALVRELGVPSVRLPSDGSAEAAAPRSFPQASAMAAEPLRFYVRTVKAGYRAAYLKELAGRVASGDLDPRGWLDAARPVEEIRREILSIKGAGRYVADNVLKLLGRYDGLGIDSWCRRTFARIHRRGRTVTDRGIERFYAPFGRWRGLALWCDLTRDWFDGDQPSPLLVEAREG